VPEPTHADSGVLAQTSKMFIDVHDQLLEKLTNLMNDVVSTSSAWQGRGGTSFQVVTDEWSTDQKRMLQALKETADAMLTSGRTYAASDDSATTRMNATYPLPL
jgi:WXG100 family type VII secretion target